MYLTFFLTTATSTLLSLTAQQNQYLLYTCSFHWLTGNASKQLSKSLVWCQKWICIQLDWWL